jgi:hypothetical protein
MLLGRTVLGFAAIVTALGAVGSPARAQQQQMACANDIVPLRTAVEKAGLSVKASIEGKADRSVICEKIKSFAANEAKFVKYLETNASWCGIPGEALQQVKDTHTRTLKMRGQACAAGPGPAARQGPPPGPGLSDALGTIRAPAAADNKNDRGTYNTLTGNPLQR